ncbi:tRNA (adenosine(37)-N6)-threonylcarbamoyltransferase complex ATPase subunit type 1 TsaE [Catenovulum sp. 2E275]|uniref:tRNA (adenosine(37)-N6)-threonylcarbamoyltransferase complex ATPase subunit type 1 TsaE n=1 Tax=Catenovulum sp. 2E275 TaxID=2980497 RepID=UPI0021CE9CDD|nr:tRNA (adenosine(37)-N6)-threonylcarbamoyltransferase complex ATPase subunit type 1 TsaE [Catenovulum sp. 2E275]MCU4676342.1 tRNA (adenosine(37)-N6)-threonylcarbamoyltransferase complex ATPase subunit type 1 TsaE [Catenovulum sp. 2E275]
MIKKIQLQNPDATVKLGGQLAKTLTPPCVIYLIGDLGAGKTTLSRGIIQGFGFNGAVKSPTYTLVEPYQLEEVNIYHFDLYRLADPEELEYIGIREYFDNNSISIIEWPEKGAQWLAEPDLIVNMTHDNEQRLVEISAKSSIGELIINKL